MIAPAPPPPRRAWAIVQVALWVLLPVALFAPGINWGLPHTSDWAVDTIAPLVPLNAFAKQFSHGWWNSYPPLQIFLLGIAYVPYLAWLWLTGGIDHPTRHFPYGFADPETAFSGLLLISRLLTVAMAVATLRVLRQIGNRRFRPAVGDVAALLLLPNYLFLYYGTFANVDIPYLLWFVVALHYAGEHLEHGRTADLTRAFLAATAAVCSKDQAYGLVVGLGLALAAASPLPRPARLKALARALAAAVLLFVLIHNWPLNLKGFLTHVDQIVHEKTYARIYPLSPAGIGGLIVATATVVAESGGLPLLLLSLAGVILAWRRARAFTAVCLACSLAYFGLFLVVIGYLFPRFTLPLLVVACLLAAVTLDAIRERWRAAGVAATAVAFGLALASGVTVPAALVKSSRYELERYLEQHASRGERVEMYARVEYQPRFPAGVAVYDVPLEERDAAALSRRSPDWILLTSWPERERMSQSEFVRALVAGDLGYRPVASFRGVDGPGSAVVHGLHMRYLLLARSTSAVPSEVRPGEGLPW